jgi:hypothetical protein
MTVWNLRVFERRQPGQRKDPSYVTVAHGPGEVAQAITNLLHHPDKVTRVDITPKGSAPEPAPAPKPVKAQSIEWREEAHPKGESWVGYIGDRRVADVFRYTYEGSVKESCSYSLFLGGGPDEQYLTCSSIESGKRSAQKALNKVVQTLVGGN